MVAPIPPISHEEISLDYVRHLIGADARIILEIGAHHGWHTAAFLNIFQNAEIFAFEPDPRAIAKFKASIANPRVRLFEMAIGASDGEATFHVSSGFPPGQPPAVVANYPQGWDQSGSLRRPKTYKAMWPWLKFEHTTTVMVCRLDSWAREHDIGVIDFIWADMQGAEGDLVAGGENTLARARYLYVEYSDVEIYEGEPTLQMLLDMLPKFRVVKRYPGDVLLMNTALEIGEKLS